MKQYLLDYQSWKTAVVESDRLETSGDAMQPLMEATVQDIQKLLPLAELGTSGADGIMGKNTRDAIYKALTAAKAAVPTPVGTGATNLPEITVKPNISTGGTLGTSATVGTLGTSATVGTSGTSATVGTSGTSATVGTSGTSATVGTSGKVTLTSQQKIDAAKAALQKAEDEAKSERQGDRTQNKIERKEKRIENRQAVVDKLKSGLKVADS